MEVLRSMPNAHDSERKRLRRTWPEQKEVSTRLRLVMEIPNLMAADAGWNKRPQIDQLSTR